MTTVLEIINLKDDLKALSDSLNLDINYLLYGDTPSQDGILHFSGVLELHTSTKVLEYRPAHHSIIARYYNNNDGIGCHTRVETTQLAKDFLANEILLESI